MAKRRRRDGFDVDPDKIEYFLALRSLKLMELGDRSGVSYDTLRQYMCGARRPRARNFKRIYIALGCGPEDIIKARFKLQHLRDQSPADD